MNGINWMSINTIYPELNLVVLIFAALIGGLFVWPKADIRFHALAIVILICTGLQVYLTMPANVTSFNNMLMDDAYARQVKLLIIAAAIFALLISTRWLTSNGGKPFEYHILVLLATLGMMFLVSSNDLLSVYVSIELMSLSLYVLAGFERDHLKSSEAGLKYFVLGALSSGLLLYGISLIYGFTGTTNFTDLATYFSQFGDDSANGLNQAILVGLVLVLVGFSFKIAAVPFHMWTPDVYEGAPTTVTAFFAVAPKVAAIALLTRILMMPFADLFTYWQQIIVFMSLASLLVGALGALMQSNIKRLLAYSSIGHVGFMLMGLATGTSTGVESVLIYLALYVFMSVGAFGCILLLHKNGEPIEHLDQFKGLSTSHPLIAGALAAFMFSMAGIPPLSGFFGKMYVVLAAITHGLIWLAVVGLLISVIACYYYIKVVKLMYFDTDETHAEIHREPLVVTAVIISLLITVAYVAAPALLVSYAENAAQALLP